jgi:hypothetical protein
VYLSFYQELSAPAGTEVWLGLEKSNIFLNAQDRIKKKKISALAKSEVLAAMMLTIQAFWFVRLSKGSKESRASYFKARAVYVYIFFCIA